MMETFYTQQRINGKIVAVKKTGHIEKFGNNIICFYKGNGDGCGFKFWCPIDKDTGLSILKFDDDREQLTTFKKAEQFTKDHIDRLDSFKDKQANKYKDMVEMFDRLKEFFEDD